MYIYILQNHFKAYALLYLYRYMYIMQIYCTKCLSSFENYIFYIIENTKKLS